MTDTREGYQPKDGEWYWCIRGVVPRVVSSKWENDRLDQLLRDTGRTFKTEEEAAAAVRARSEK